MELQFYSKQGCPAVGGRQPLSSTTASSCIKAQDLFKQFQHAAASAGVEEHEDGGMPAETDVPNSAKSLKLVAIGNLLDGP